MPKSTDTPEAHLRAALTALHSSARYVRVEANDLAAFVGQYDACHDAYTNNTAERDMYEVAYSDMRKVVKYVMDDPSLAPNLLTRLERVYRDGEVTND